MPHLTQLLAVAALTLVATAAPAQQTVYLLDRAVSEVTLHGRNTASAINGRSTGLRGAMVLAGDDITGLRGHVRFPIESLELEPRIYRRGLRQLLTRDRQPDIIFALDSARWDADLFFWLLDGRLTMAGVTKPVQFLGRARSRGDLIVAEGSTQVDVRQWGLEPGQNYFGFLSPEPNFILTFKASFRADRRGLVRPRD